MCYPSGGMQDLHGDFNSIKECHLAFKKVQKDLWYEIFDSEKRIIVFSNSLPDLNNVHKDDDSPFSEKQFRKIYPINLWQQAEYKYIPSN